MEKQRLTLYSTEDLEQVQDYEAVVCIHTNSYYQSTRFGSLLEKCINLEELYFTESFFQVTIPPVITRLPKLRVLMFKGIDCGDLLGKLDQIKAMQLLGMQRYYFKELPLSLAQCQALEALDLQQCHFNPTTYNWQVLGAIPNLKSLNMLGAKINELPDVIKELDQLSELKLPHKLYKKLLKKSPATVAQIPYVYSHNSLEKKYYGQLLSVCRKEQLDWNFRAVLMNLLANNTKKLDEQASELDVLKATDLLKVEMVRLNALQYYTKRWAKKSQPLKQGAVLTVTGTLGINKRLLQKKLKAQGIVYSAKISAKTTHLLIGQRPKGSYLEALERGIPILTESVALDFINSNAEQYLVDDSDMGEHQIQQLAQLLLSEQDDSVRLALEMFKEGGFPTVLLTEVFVAYCQSFDKEVQREASRLIRQYGSISLIDELKKSYQLFSPYSSELSIKRRLNQLAKATELNCLTIAKHGFERHKQGVSYLIKALPKAEKQSFLQRYLNEGTLTLTKLDLSSVPAEAFDLKGVEILDLSYNRSLRSIPVRLLPQFKNLKKLVLKGNYHFREKPELLDKLRVAYPELEIVL